MGNITKRSIAITAAVAALAGAGVAFAAWTTNGTGSGYGHRRSAKPLVITQTGTADWPLPDRLGQRALHREERQPVRRRPHRRHRRHLHRRRRSHRLQRCLAQSADPVTLTGTTVAANSTGTAAAQTMIIKMSNAAVDACQGAIIGFTISVTGASA